MHGDSLESAVLASTKYGRRLKVGPKFTLSDLPDCAELLFVRHKNRYVTN